MPPLHVPPLLVARERAADALGVTLERFDILVAHGIVPKPRMLTRKKPRWLFREIEACDRLAVAQFDPEEEARRQIARRAAVTARQAARRCAEVLRTPAWADLAAIRAVYLQARSLTQETGIPHHVDHDIPLRGKKVSGLHVHNNLRVLTAAQNLKKMNAFDPC